MKELVHLYAEHFGHPPDRVEEIPGSVSTRRYFHMVDGKRTIVGTWSPDRRETAAFVHFTRQFRNCGVQVPEVYAVRDDQLFYLQEDLGDDRFHERVTARKGERLDQALSDLYRASIDQLLLLQLKGHEGIDYSLCVPRPAFDSQSVLWDLYHFKYYFLKVSGIPFDEQQLETEFWAFADLIAALPMESFMFRDFQTRNIMIRDKKPFLIDYQGGRRGPLHYDLASLVFESRTALVEDDRQMLIDYYIEQLAAYRPRAAKAFLSEFYPVALVRCLQVLGTYGLRGMVEKKAVFLQSIPAGLANLGRILEKLERGVIGTHLEDLLTQLSATRDQYRKPPPHDGELHLTIFSFSYRKPLPDDLSGNGGGFVYDCRFVNNPGRLEQYRMQTGFDRDVEEYLEQDPAVAVFRETIQKQLSEAVRVYKIRGFSHLMVSFGCTGGKHRSVYFARKTAEWARSLGIMKVTEIHRELGKEF